jgi:hypothetical protein
MEPRPDLLGNRPHRLPVLLSVAALAIRAECGGVRIVVAPAAAQGGVGPDRPSVIVTPQAGRHSVRAAEPISDLFLMVE